LVLIGLFFFLRRSSLPQQLCQAPVSVPLHALEISFKCGRRCFVLFSCRDFFAHLASVSVPPLRSTRPLSPSPSYLYCFIRCWLPFFGQVVGSRQSSIYFSCQRFKVLSHAQLPTVRFYCTQDSHRVCIGLLARLFESSKRLNFGAFGCGLLCESLQDHVPVSILSRRCKRLEVS
jgi:hypothetical protein